MTVRRPIHGRRSNCGVALIIVLWVVMVLSLLIGGFAFTMQVETQVASHSRKELRAEMLARSGVEVARMELLRHSRDSREAGYEALNQGWATNTDLFVAHELGDGQYTVTVTDEERRLPLNTLNNEQWSRLLERLAVDPTEISSIVDCILDWIDSDDLHRLNGVEREYYERLDPPYRPKNGPCDRVEELLLVKGVTPELMHGTPDRDGEPGRPGLRDVLTVFSSGRVNVNTADALTLEVMFDLDEATADAVVARRNGPDGEPGTEDDRPYRSVNEFITEVGGSDPAVVMEWNRYATTVSQFFEARARGEVQGVTVTLIARFQKQGTDYQLNAWERRRGAP